MPETTSKKSAAMDPALPEKKRGRRRLIGALALFIGAAVILSIVFDHEPKPASPDLQLKIPARDKSAVAVVAPADSGQTTAPSTATVPAAPIAVTGPTEMTPSKADPAAPVVDTPAVIAPAPAVSAAKPDKPAVKAPAKSEDDPIAKLTEQTKAGNKPGSSGSFMVQIGAFSSDEKLEAARAKAKAAGFKPVTEKISTTNGERTRLRVGPFADRAAAAAARDKLKTEGLEPALIAL